MSESERPQQDVEADALAFLASGAESEVVIDPSQVPDDSEGPAVPAEDVDPAEVLAHPETMPTQSSAAVEPAAPTLAQAAVIPLYPTGQAAPPPLITSQAGSRRASAANFAKLEVRSKSLMYKQTMTPLLLIVGGMLAIVFIVGLIMLLTGPGITSNPLLLFLTIVSFPLAAVLLFGSFWFHKDVKAHAKDAPKP